MRVDSDDFRRRYAELSDEGLLSIDRKELVDVASEVVREGLRLLVERDRRLESLRRDVRTGFEAIKRGNYTDYHATTIRKLADRVNARGRKRLAAEQVKSRYR